MLNDATDRERIPKSAWQAVEQEMSQVMDQFKHKKRLRPAMHELLGKLVVQQDYPVATPSSVPAQVVEPSAFILYASVRGRPIKIRRKNEP